MQANGSKFYDTAPLQALGPLEKNNPTIGLFEPQPSTCGHQPFWSFGRQKSAAGGGVSRYREAA